MRQPNPPAAARYALAVASVAAAIAIRWALDVTTGADSPSLVLLSAVMVSAWYGGLRPGLLATALSQAAIAYWFFQPRSSFQVENSAALIRIALFGVEGALVSAIIAALHASRARAEDAARELKASEARFRTLVEAAPVGITFARGGATRFANAAYARMFGYDEPSQMDGIPILDQIAPEDRATVADRHRRRLAGEEQPRSYEAMGVRRDGTAFPFRIDVAQIQLPDGEATLGFLADVTERHRVERDLLDRERRLRRLFESNLIGIIVAGVDGKVAEANRAFLQMVGYDADDLAAGRLDWLAMTPPEHREADAAALESLRRAGSHTPYEKEFLRKDGSRVSVLVGTGVLEGEDGLAVGFILDVTARRRAEQAERDAARQVNAILESIADAFFAVDSDWRLTYLNRHCEPLATGDRAGLIGRPVWEALPGLARTELAGRLPEALRDGQPAHFEMPWPDTGGWFEVFVYPSPGGLSVQLRDVSERRRAESALQFLADASAELAATLDEDEALARVARLAVPAIADACRIDAVRADGTIERVAAVDRDADRASRASEAFVASEVASVAASGLPEASSDPEADPGLAAEGFGSRLCMPAIARGRVLAVITLLGERADRRFGPADLALAEILARRVGQASDNARLFRQVQSGLARLAETQAVVDAFLAAAPMGVAFLDTELRYVRINEVLAALNGRPVAEHLGRTFREVLPEAAELHEHLLRGVVEARRPVNDVHFSGEVPGNPGRVGEWVGSYYPAFGADGRVIGIGVIVVEVTEARRAERALLESETRLRSLVGANILGIFIGDASGRILEANDAFLDLVGYDRDDLESGLLLRNRLTPPEYQDRDRQAVRELIETGACTPFEKEYRRKDGSRVPILVGAALLDRENPRWIGFVLDLSERRRFEQELQKRGQSLRLLSDSATRLLGDERPEDLARDLFRELAEHLGIEVSLNYLLSDDGKALNLSLCTGVDDATCRRIQRIRVGEAACGLVARDRVPMIFEAVQEGAEPHTELLRSLGLRAYACHPLLAQGRLFGTLSFGSKTRDRFDPEELHLMRTVCDQVAVALERKRLVLELSRRARDLAEANAAKDQFLAVLSHELRTPLTPVLVAVSAMLDDPETPASVRPTLEVTRRNVELEARLIDDLLDITRISQGKLHLNRRPVDAHGLFRQAVEICRDDIARGGLTLEVDLAATSTHVLADPARVQQIAWNLLKNAVKFTPPGGKIAVRSRDEPVEGGPPRLVLEVSDTGIGIPPEVLPRLFQAFEQGDAAVTKQFGGLGLGLAICRSLAETHDGSLTASSEGRGLGATFRLELPTTRPVPSDRPSRPSPELNDGPLRPLRILLVEDNPDTLRIMARLLRGKGHEVTTAESVGEGLRAAEAAGALDLVISDIGLPDGSGLELLRKLRADRPIRAIALSGYGMELDVMRSEHAGFVAHLTKPVDFASLEAAIRAVVDADEPELAGSPPSTGPG